MIYIFIILDIRSWAHVSNHWILLIFRDIWCRKSQLESNSFKIFFDVTNGHPFWQKATLKHCPEIITAAIAYELMQFDFSKEKKIFEKWVLGVQTCLCFVIWCQLIFGLPISSCENVFLQAKDEKTGTVKKCIVFSSLHSTLLDFKVTLLTSNSRKWKY